MAKKATAKAKRAEVDESTWVLKLYVAGETLNSIKAIANLKTICSEYVTTKYSIEVIDLVKHPHLAKGEQIFATPTLIRHWPKPVRQIIGDLSNVEKVLAGLEIQKS
jgi:circadian clock protein KaiB